MFIARPPNGLVYVFLLYVIFRFRFLTVFMSSLVSYFAYYPCLCRVVSPTPTSYPFNVSVFKFPFPSLYVPFALTLIKVISNSNPVLNFYLLDLDWRFPLISFEMLILLLIWLPSLESLSIRLKKTCIYHPYHEYSKTSYKWRCLLTIR